MPLAMTGPQVCWKRTRKSSARAPLSSWHGGQLTAEHERHDDVERLVVARRQAGPGPLGRAVDDGGLLGVQATAGHHVGAVAVHRDEQGLERPAHRREVDVDQHVAGEPHQPVDLGGLHVVDDEPLRLGDHVVERLPGRARHPPTAGRARRPRPTR